MSPGVWSLSVWTSSYQVPRGCSLSYGNLIQSNIVPNEENRVSSVHDVWITLWSYGGSITIGFSSSFVKRSENIWLAKFTIHPPRKVLCRGSKSLSYLKTCYLKNKTMLYRGWKPLIIIYTYRVANLYKQIKMLLII